MSALAMILTPAMVVQEYMPDKLSGGTKQRLDLSGEWVFTFPPDNSEVIGRGEDFIRMFEVRDEGDGKFCMAFWTETDYLRRHILVGIYRQDEGRVLMCFGREDKTRPTSFRTEDGQFFLTLHRVKPSK